MLSTTFAAWWAAQKRKKPVGCAVCMGFWCTQAFYFVGNRTDAPKWDVSPVVGLAGILASCAIAAWLNYHLVPPPMGGAALDDLEVDDSLYQRYLGAKPDATPTAVPIMKCKHPYHLKVFDPKETEPCPTCMTLYPRAANFKFANYANDGSRSGVGPALCVDVWHSDSANWVWKDAGLDWGDPTGKTRMETTSCPSCGGSVSRPKRS